MITRGDIKYLSGQLESFIMYFSYNNFFEFFIDLILKINSYASTFLVSKLEIFVKVKFSRTTRFFVLPIREIRLGKFFAMCSLNSDDEEMLLTWLPWDEVDCVTARPKLPNRSLPSRGFRTTATKVEIAKFDVQPSLVIWVCIFPTMWIGSLENVLSCGLTFLWI